MQNQLICNNLLAELFQQQTSLPEQDTRIHEVCFKSYLPLRNHPGYPALLVYQSGTSVRGKGHICKMGKSQIRKLLYLCSWSAKRCNQNCKKMYDRLKEKGKPERVIKIALANKLLKQAFSIVKKQTYYTENFVEKACL